MLKTCKICGYIHDFNKICKRVSTKKSTLESKFRKNYQRTIKSKQIRIKDKYLCQICIRDKYDTNFLYNYNELEVHHILFINEYYNLRLDDMNLITLCRYYYEMVEKQIISKKGFIEIVESKY